MQRPFIFACLVTILFCTPLFSETYKTVTKMNPHTGKLDYTLDGKQIFNTVSGVESALKTYTGIGNGRAVLGRQATFTSISATSFNSTKTHMTIIPNTTSSSIFIGNGTGVANTTGLGNVAIGSSSFSTNVSGDSNIAIGAQSLPVYNQAGYGYNIAVGQRAGYNLETGARNTFIGYFTQSAGTYAINETVIGNGAVGNGSNTVTIGDSSITDNYLQNNLYVPQVTGGTGTGDELELKGSSSDPTAVTVSRGTAYGNFSGGTIKASSIPMLVSHEQNGSSHINGIYSFSSPLSFNTRSRAAILKNYTGGAYSDAVMVTGNNTGIGAAFPPAATAHIANNTASATRGLIVAQHNAGAQSAQITFRKTRGTFTNNSSVVTGDFIGAFNAQAHDGYQVINPAYFGFLSDDTVVAGSTTPSPVETNTGYVGRVPTSIVFATGARQGNAAFSGTRKERLRITSDGRIRITNQPAAPAATDACTAGDTIWQSPYLYLCHASGDWRRTTFVTY